MKVQYIEKTKIAYFDGLRFTRDDKTGYYLSTKKRNSKRFRLHRYIWEYYNGVIPKGYVVHHIDHNKNNNELYNLELLSSSEHKKRHAKELTNEQRQKLRENFNKNARPKAIEWHKSDEAKKWHKEQYKKTLGNAQTKNYICLNCQKEFEAKPYGINKFCSNKCKSAYRRKTGVDNITRNCIVCGNVFHCNKYSKIQKCVNCTPERYRKARKK